MEKAIILLDEVPHCCDMCYLCRIRPKGRYCVKTRKYDNNFGRRQKNCPIKLLPKKKNKEDIAISGEAKEILNGRYEGWNDCIDEISGGENE